MLKSNLQPEFTPIASMRPIDYLCKQNMKAANINFNLIETYLELLKSLNPDSKRELIARLSQSLNEPKQSGGRTLGELFGAFDSDQSAEEIIADIEKSRTFTRKSEEF